MNYWQLLKNVCVTIVLIEIFCITAGFFAYLIFREKYSQ